MAPCISLLMETELLINVISILQVTYYYGWMNCFPFHSQMNCGLYQHPVLISFSVQCCFTQHLEKLHSSDMHLITIIHQKLNWLVYNCISLSSSLVEYSRIGCTVIVPHHGIISEPFKDLIRSTRTIKQLQLSF